MKKLAIIGSGDLGQQIAHHVEIDKQFDVIGYFDDFKSRGDQVNGVPVLGKLRDISQNFKNGLFDELLIGIGYKHMDFRSSIFEELRTEIPFAKFVHSSCYFDATAIVGDGTIIFPSCIIDQHVVLGDNILINVGSCIAHDSEIKKNTFLSPRVAIAGFVKVGENCIIGINSTIIDNVEIPNKTQIGAGTVVIKSLKEQGLYVGNPARFIR